MLTIRVPYGKSAPSHRAARPDGQITQARPDRATEADH